MRPRCYVHAILIPSLLIQQWFEYPNDTEEIHHENYKNNCPGFKGHWVLKSSTQRFIKVNNKYNILILSLVITNQIFQILLHDRSEAWLDSTNILYIFVNYHNIQKRNIISFHYSYVFYYFLTTVTRWRIERSKTTNNVIYLSIYEAVYHLLQL